MIAALLMMIAGGIGLSQWISHPRQVTLAWLRLGGLISVSLLSVAAVFWLGSGGRIEPATTSLGAGALVLSVSQLTAAQLGRPAWSRVAGGLSYLLCVGCVWFATSPMIDGTAEPGGPAGLNPAVWALTLALGSALQGGFLMTMLLGHAYLAADGQMTQRPLLRLTIALACLLALRTAVSGVTGLWPYMLVDAGGSIPISGGFGSGGGGMGFGGSAWQVMMITARYAVGIVVPAVFVYMIYDCVRRRANQSATGILYVATVLVILGEGMALSLAGSIGLAF